MRRATLLAALLACAAPAVAVASENSFYPDDVESLVYSGWAVTLLERVGEKPLWHSVEHGVIRHTRFVFSDGRPMKTRILHFRERGDGSGTLHVFSIDHRWRKPIRIERDSTIKLDAAQLAVINRLAEQSTAFDFEAGSWDGESIYMHCQLLEMERADVSGYRYSSVNIGCNQPAKLMPLVEHVMALAKIKRRDPQLL